jgi:hypothetical protein
VKGRLAPSPTGALHLGHALSFLIAWWHARSQGGQVVLRLEDVDVERASAAHCDAAIRDLQWLGLDWDGEVRVQSSRVGGSSTQPCSLPLAVTLTLVFVRAGNCDPRVRRKPASRAPVPRALPRTLC